MVEDVGEAFGGVVAEDSGVEGRGKLFCNVSVFALDLFEGDLRFNDFPSGG